MKRVTKLTALLAIAAAAPAVVMPALVPAASAQERAFEDVPLDHWAYPALQRLAQAGIVEGYPPTGNYIGSRALTRYEFAVAIARLLDRFPTIPALPAPTQPYDDTALRNRVTALEARPVPDITRAQVNDLLLALQREFRDELARLGARVDALESRVGVLENRVTPPPRLTLAPSFLHRTGRTNYISNATRTPTTSAGGRFFLPGGVGSNDGVSGDPFGNPASGIESDSDRIANEKFSYTEFELRLTDRVSDRLSLNAAIRSLGGTDEDAWAGENDGQVYVREAFASANLADRRPLGLTGLTAVLGRQRTKIAQGLLYDNDLQPTDQIRGSFNVGPVAVTGFVGSNNNVSLLGSGDGLNPYASQGSVYYLDTGGVDQDAVGFPGINEGPGFVDDNETLARASVNLFRLAGKPVQLGISRAFDSYERQEGTSVDLTLPLFNRTLGFEYVRQTRQASGLRNEDIGSGDERNAYIATLPVLRTSILDLNVAYGEADENFEYFAVSSANPYARTYGEAIFDRPIALGAPLINTSGDGPQFVAAKRAFDVTGTLRIPFSFLRRVPLDFRYYEASGENGLGGGAVDLGQVYSVGTRFSVASGVDIEVKGGIYDPDGESDVTGVDDLRYIRVGATVGF